MANEEQLRLLKEGGVKEWNAWREENPKVEVDLSEANLRYANLRYANLRDANLRNANLRNANLRNAKLSNAKLSNAKLSDAKLSNADLYNADLSNVSLHNADLSKANLHNAYLREAILSNADLSNVSLHNADLSNAVLISTKLFDAYLRYADLSNADLREADLSNADFTATNLSNANLCKADLHNTDLRYANLHYTNLDAAVFHNTILDVESLSSAIGLDKIKHEGPSTIGQRTLQLSQGQLPDVFLKGCGLSPWEIAASKLHNPELTPKETLKIIYEIDDLRNKTSIQLRQVFISYTEANGRFVDRIEKNFDAQGIRFWRDIHHATAGPLDKVIERAIDHSSVFLLILSERSVDSDWVEVEVTKARELEKDKDQHLICPIAIDDSWKTCRWSPKLRTQIEKYHILDFSQWEDEAYFEQQYTKLLDGLNLFYLRG